VSGVSEERTLVQRLERQAVRGEAWLWALLPFALSGFALGVGIWWRLHREHRAYFLSNKLSTQLRYDAVCYPLLGALLLVGAALGYALLRARSQERTALELLLGCRRLLAPVLWGLGSLPLLAFISAPRTEDKVPGFLSLVIVASGLVVALAGLQAAARWSLSARFAERLRGARLVRAGRILAVFSVLCGVLYYSSKLSHLSIALHRNLGSHMVLAVYENVLWNTAHGNFLGCSICAGGTHASSHFDPFTAVFAAI